MRQIAPIRILVAAALGAALARGAVSALRAAVPPAAEPSTARQIMEEVDRWHRTESQYSEGLLSVEEKGKIRKKAWRSWRTGWGATARNLVQFLDPPEVKGVSLLTVGHADRPDEQWFYTPAIDRDRRIASQEKSTKFLGTHFTYEDMEERDLDDYQYALLDEQPVDGAPCWRVEATPTRQKESQYSKLIFWVRKDAFTSVRIEGFEGSTPRRNFRGSDLAEVEGVQTVRRWEVTDSKREGKTTLDLRDVHYRAPVDAGIFTIQGLRVFHNPPR